MPLIAERYKPPSLVIISNLVLIEGNWVFANVTAMADTIDGIAHHFAIVEFDLSSYMTSDAQDRQLQERQLHRTPKTRRSLSRITTYVILRHWAPSKLRHLRAYVILKGTLTGD